MKSRRYCMKSQEVEGDSVIYSAACGEVQKNANTSDMFCGCLKDLISCCGLAGQRSAHKVGIW